MTSIRQRLKAGPGGASLVKVHRFLRRRVLKVKNSTAFWDAHYANGGSSGPGSYGDSARFKADFLNGLIQRHGLMSAIEFGCGDGYQLGLIHYPKYIGLDVAPNALRRCVDQYRDDVSKSFYLYRYDCVLDHAGFFTADVALSLDVIFHLLEDEIYEGYMRDLFLAGDRLVVIYSSNSDEPGEDPSVRHRPVTTWVAENASDWTLIEKTERPHTDDCFADFFVYERCARRS
jgi:hypothetical protein